MRLCRGQLMRSSRFSAMLPPCNDCGDRRNLPISENHSKTSPRFLNWSVMSLLNRSASLCIHTRQLAQIWQNLGGQMLGHTVSGAKMAEGLWERVIRGSAFPRVSFQPCEDSDKKFCRGFLSALPAPSSGSWRYGYVITQPMAC